MKRLPLDEPIVFDEPTWFVARLDMDAERASIKPAKSREEAFRISERENALQRNLATRRRQRNDLPPAA